MLLEISIKTLSNIEAISLNFWEGMTVLTGKPVLKSIIIDAMNMMLGARATTDVIRHGLQGWNRRSFSVENSQCFANDFDEQGIELGVMKSSSVEIYKTGVVS